MNQFLWFASFGSMLLIVFGKIYFLKYEYYQSLAVVHNALSPTLWALALCWIVFTCTKNTTGTLPPQTSPIKLLPNEYVLGIINRFLSHRVFLVLSRLNYSIYLLHLCVISLIYSRQQTPDYIDNLKSVSTSAFCNDGVFKLWSLDASFLGRLCLQFLRRRALFSYIRITSNCHGEDAFKKR